MPSEDKVVLQELDKDVMVRAPVSQNEVLQNVVPQNETLVESVQIDTQIDGIPEIEIIDESELIFVEDTPSALTQSMTSQAPSFIEEVYVEESPVIISSDAGEVKELRARLEAMERQLKNRSSNYEQTIRSLETEVSSLRKRKLSSSSVSSPRRAAQKTTSRSVWELRAAQPGRAWVSKKGQKEMRPVVVGDKLPGLGRIQSITYQNQKWVVVGHEGQITQ